MYSCSNNSTIGPFENEKEGCKENMDTLLSHLNGWKVINTYYDVDCFCSTTDKDGQRTDYQKYSLVARITDGLDTLTVVQFDSLITADNLPAYKKWIKTYLKDAETNESIEYSTLYDKTTDIIYTIKYLTTNKKYVVLKRKTIK
jgi:hypothetical protein